MCRKDRSTFISLTAVECVRWTHGIKIERNTLLCEQAPTEVFRSIFAWLVTLKLLNLQPAFDQALGIVHGASMDGKSLFHDRTFCGLTDIVLGMGQTAAFMGAEGMNGLP